MKSTQMIPAAFKDGDRIEYIGDRLSTTIHNGKEIYVNKKGKVWSVIETRLPEKGYGFIKNDEEGEPIIDHDSDGYNVIIDEHGFKRLLWPMSKNEWKLLK